MPAKFLRAGLLAAATFAPAVGFAQDQRSIIAPPQRATLEGQILDKEFCPEGHAGWGGPSIPPYLYHHPTYHLFRNPVFHHPLYHHPAYHAPYYPPSIHHPIGGPLRRKWPCHGTGDLFPHVEYYPEAHGYYRFMPTTYEGVMLQCRVSAVLGGDPKNPCDNRHVDDIFDRLGHKSPRDKQKAEEEETDPQPAKRRETTEELKPPMKTEDKNPNTDEIKDEIEQSQRSRNFRRATQPRGTRTSSVDSAPELQRKSQTIQVVDDGDEAVRLNESQSSNRRAARPEYADRQSVPAKTNATAAAAQRTARAPVTQSYDPPEPAVAADQPRIDSGVRPASHQQPVKKRGSGLIDRLLGNKN